VQKESHLRELARSVVLNPVRARMVVDVADWPWSSYRHTILRHAAPSWLQTDWMLAQFGDTALAAIAAYKRFVRDGVGAASPLAQTRHHLLLGDDTFGASLRLDSQQRPLHDIPKAQRRALACSLAEYQVRHAERDLAIIAAYASTAYSMGQIAAHFGISARTVSRIVNRHERLLQTSSCPNVRSDPGYK
jgi:DNA-binding CsgD family transcriptional regulator